MPNEMKYFILAINEAKIREMPTAEGIRTHLAGTGGRYYGAVFVTELAGDPMQELAELRMANHYLEARLKAVTEDYEAEARKAERLGQDLDVLRAAYANACKERLEKMCSTITDENRQPEMKP